MINLIRYGSTTYILLIDMTKAFGINVSKALQQSWKDGSTNVVLRNLSLVSESFQQFGK